MNDEYISKLKVIDYLNGYLHSLGEGGADDLLFDRGQRRALINAIQDISAVKAADVQPVNQWINRIARLKQELCKSNKTVNKYYSVLKKINEICDKNSCTANSEYLSDLLYEIERNVINALSDNNTTCKAKD